MVEDWLALISNMNGAVSGLRQAAPEVMKTFGDQRQYSLRPLHCLSYRGRYQAGCLAGGDSRLAAGLLFGLGLTVSQMINPAKVIAFLDFAGDWDPSLAFVMAGAIPVAAIGFALGKRRQGPLCASEFAGP